MRRLNGGNDLQPLPVPTRFHKQQDGKSAREATNILQRRRPHILSIDAPHVVAQLHTRLLRRAVLPHTAPSLAGPTPQDPRPLHIHRRTPPQLQPHSSILRAPHVAAPQRRPDHQAQRVAGSGGHQRPQTLRVRHTTCGADELGGTAGGKDGPPQTCRARACC